jgi:DNA polymerase I-like protein with 3'-5' exonuclease and polymerase domains
MIEVNTSARKYRIPVKITEQDAESALRVFHKMTPNIEQVYFPEVIEAIKSTRRLIAPLPYGVNARFGGTRTFYERWGDELFREAFSYIPQRAVSDNTKAAGIRIKARAPFAKIILESHDALLFSIEENETEDFIPIAVEEMERPINFENCSLPRESLAIPCEAEIGYNYKDFKKFEFENLNRPVFKEPEPVTITDRFRV